MTHTTYGDIYAELRDDIANGTYPIGSTLPSQMALGARFKVAQMTVRRALDVLQDEGLIAQRRGVRTLVIRHPVGPTPNPSQRSRTTTTQTLEATLDELRRVTAERDSLLESHGHPAPTTEPRATTSTSLELAALRHAVDQLTHKLGAAPAYRPPDRIWVEPVSNIQYGEWDIQGYRDERILAVRAGMDEGVPGVFLVDRRGDMHALEVPDTYRLVEALCGSLTYLNQQQDQP